MKRREVEAQLRSIARVKGVEMTFTEGGKHTKVQFDGQFVTTVPRHREVNERTVRSILNAARRWEPS